MALIAETENTTVMSLNAKTENTTLRVNQGSDDGSDRRNREYDSDGSECQTKTDDYERQFKEDDSERNKWEDMEALNVKLKNDQGLWTPKWTTALNTKMNDGSEHHTRRNIAERQFGIKALHAQLNW